MKIFHKSTWSLLGLLAALSAPAWATVTVTSIHASPAAPQVIGTPITWTVTATDTNPNPLTFQFDIESPGASSYTMVRDYNVGTLSGGVWTSPPFVWTPTGPEGTYTIKVVAKDFVSGETGQKVGPYQVNPLVTGSTPVVVATSNPLVALFSAPSCASGSTMRVSFKKTGAKTPAATNYVSCTGSTTMTFEIAGMYPKTAYTMNSQTKTGSKITNGTPLSFTTGSLPTNIPFPTYKVVVAAGPNTDTAAPVLLSNPIQFGAGPIYTSVATDLAGRTLWYYYPTPAQSMVLTRPLAGGTMLTIQSGIAWNPKVANKQYLRQIDLAGNIIKETNIGVIQQQLLKLGYTDGGPCTSTPVVGSACVDDFHHDAIQTLPNGDTAVLVDLEKIYPAGTQGDTTGKPVDIVGDGIVVMNSSWQVVWFWDAFQHAGGAPQLDINRAAVLGETCVAGESGCPPLGLLGPTIAPDAKDWLHCNALYYWGTDTSGGASGDIILSSRNQDWVMKIDYNNGTGTSNILWIMGLDGAFTFNNVTNDTYPWFSGQHEVAIENAGAGPMTIFDNGNTRVSVAGSGNSRGMALTVDETTMTVTPVLLVDLGVLSIADGSAQLLSDGNYYFLPAVVLVGTNEFSYSMEIKPTGIATGTTVLNISGPDGYRGWQMLSLYAPPTT